MKNNKNNMSGYEKLYAPFSINKTRKMMAYYNNEIEPLLNKKNIDRDINTERLIVCGKRFPMMNIDNGQCEKFIRNLIVEEENGQMKLDMWRKSE